MCGKFNVSCILSLVMLLLATASCGKGKTVSQKDAPADTSAIYAWETEIKQDPDVAEIKKTSKEIPVGIIYFQCKQEDNRPYVCVAVDGKIVFSGNVAAPVKEEIKVFPNVGTTVMAQAMWLERGKHVIQVYDAAAKLKGKKVIEVTEDCWIVITRDNNSDTYIITVSKWRPLLA